MSRGSVVAPVTRQEIIEAAGLQFGKNGFEGTSFGRIAEAMGRPKSAIGYHLFPSKLELAHAVITHQQRRWKTIYDSLPKDDGLDRLIEFLLTCAFDSRDCPLARGATRMLREFAQSGTPRPRDFVWSTIVHSQLQAATKAGDLDPIALSAGSVSLILNATFGLIGGTRTEDDDELESQLKSLWVPLLASFGLARATERIAALHPHPVPPAEHAPSDGSSKDTLSNPQPQTDPAKIREWAAAHGYDVSSRGRISRSIHTAYNLASGAASATPAD